MFRHNLAMLIVYGSLMYVYSKCKDLECKLAVKTYECELYKTIAEQAVRTEKTDKKKEK